MYSKYLPPASNYLNIRIFGNNLINFDKLFRSVCSSESIYLYLFKILCYSNLLFCEESTKPLDDFA